MILSVRRSFTKTFILKIIIIIDMNTSIKKIFIRTQGCSNNASESEIMGGILEAGGYQIVSNPDRADLIMINVCTVKGDNTALRAVKDALRDFHGKKIVVAGCLTKSLVSEIKRIAPNASMLNTNNLHKVKKVVDATFADKQVEELIDDFQCKIGMPKKRISNIVGIVPISSGCNQYCAYCSVILVKGKLRSYPVEAIVNEIKRSVAEGCKEIWITSQDNGSYGTESSGKSRLPELLQKVVQVEGDFKVRVGMMNPHFLKTMTKEMIAAFKNDKMFKFLHVPVQSGSDDVLKLMRRKYDAKDFEKIVSDFRKEIPDVTIATDVIIGFPGESDGDFEKTFALVKKIKPDVLNISRFVAREGTMAATLEPHVSSNAIKERSQRMTNVFGEICLAKNKKWIGWKGEVIVDEVGKEGTGTMVGRNHAYKPVILKGNLELGKRIRVKIIDATSNDLRAQLC